MDSTAADHPQIRQMAAAGGNSRGQHTAPVLPGYSTNLHRGERIDELLAELLPFATAVRSQLGWPWLPLDLRLGSAALGDLALPGALANLRRKLDEAGLRVLTINGFPLGTFQAQRVKELAYEPDWSDPRRLDASVQLLTAALALSDQPLVTISTVPGGFGRSGDHVAMAVHLARWVAAAHRARLDTGRTAVLCLEPEPWCLLETSHDVAWWWNGPLRQFALPELQRAAGLSATAANDALASHLGVCVDTCHLSLAFEDQVAAVERMAAAGARIAKCQVSAAPEVRNPRRDHDGLAALRSLAEPRFLHQTAARSAAGSMGRCVDLDGLSSMLERLPGADAVRSHFHIPLVHQPGDPAAGLGGSLFSTIEDSWKGLQACIEHGCTHVAVETYTWSILAPQQHDALRGTARELALLHQQLTARAPTTVD